MHTNCVNSILLERGDNSSVDGRKNTWGSGRVKRNSGSAVTAISTCADYPQKQPVEPTFGGSQPAETSSRCGTGTGASPPNQSAKHRRRCLGSCTDVSRNPGCTTPTSWASRAASLTLQSSRCCCCCSAWHHQAEVPDEQTVTTRRRARPLLYLLRYAATRGKRKQNTSAACSLIPLAKLMEMPSFVRVTNSGLLTACCWEQQQRRQQLLHSDFGRRRLHDGRLLQRGEQ